MTKQDPASQINRLQRPRVESSPAIDLETVTTVFRECHAPLLRVAYGITKDWNSASDVVQDVFLKLWDDRQRLSVKVTLKALLYTMVRNRALNAIRRKKALVDTMVVEAVSDARAANGYENDGAATSDLQRRLYCWIKQLPERRSEAFMLSRYHELSHAEIASIMGVSVRTVNAHILAALTDLRTRLEESEKDGVTR